MGCMKCGRETINEQAFCPNCIQEMKKYPVRPGTVVQIPKRPAATAVKKQPKKRVIPPEEQVKILKVRVRNLILALILAIGIAAACAVPAMKYVMDNQFKIGQNYSTITVPSETN